MEDARKMLEALIQHSPLTVFAAADYAYDPLRSLLSIPGRKTTPSSDISLDTDGQDDVGDTTPWDTLELCPDWTSISLRPGDALTRGIVLSWHQITSTTLDCSFSVDNAFNILSRCSSLERLYVGTMDDD
uniref:Uncharacterized protein n=1 Tax=Moniliophthora roreri TaxID=221103 RepID=A0A0W0F051_MONRR